MTNHQLRPFLSQEVALDMVADAVNNNISGDEEDNEKKNNEEEDLEM